MKRLITYLTCATLVAAGGYASYQRALVRGGLQGADVAEVANLRVQRAVEQKSNAVKPTSKQEKQSAQMADARVSHRAAAYNIAKLKGQNSLIKAAPKGKLRMATQSASATTYSFNSQADLTNDWTVIDNNKDDFTWAYSNEVVQGSGVAALWYNEDGTTPSDDYMVLKSPVSLEAGNAYVSMTYGGLSSYGTENLEILWGTSSDVTQMTSLKQYPNFTNEGYVLEDVVDFTVDTEGDYYFAIHGYSDANQWGVFVIDFTVGSGEYVPAADIAVLGITPPTPSSSLTANEEISVTVGNYGPGNVGSFKLEVTVTGPDGTPKTYPAQTYDQAIEAGMMDEVSYDQAIDMSAAGVYSIEVTASCTPAAGSSEDVNMENDSYTVSATHFTTTDVPFTTDFSDGLQPSMWNSDGSWLYADGYGIGCAGTGALMSQGVNLEAGKTYRISYTYYAGDYFELFGQIYPIPEAYEILCGPDGGELTSIYSTAEAFTQGEFVSGEATYACEQNGVYQFAFSQSEPGGTFIISGITVSEVAGYDLAVKSVSGLPTILPASQGATGSVVIENRGASACSGTITISSGDNELATVKVPEIAAQGVSEIPVEFKLTGIEAGTTAQIEVSVAVDGQTDSDESNNTATVAIEASDDVLGYDKADASDLETFAYGIIGVGGGSYTAGLPIHLTDDDVITGVSVGVATMDAMGNIGEIPAGLQLQLSLYELDKEDIYSDPYYGQSGYYLGEELFNTTVDMGTEIGQIDYAVNPRTLAAGDYMLCVTVPDSYLVSDMESTGLLYLINSGVAIDQSDAGLGTIDIRAILGEGTPTTNNLTVNAITSPADEGLFATNQPVVVSVTNNGSAAADGSLSVTVNGEEIGTQAVQLEAYKTGEYTFTADLSEPGEYTIVATATLTGDENPDDNSVEKVVTSVEALDPYVMNFEGCADFAVDNFNPAWTTVDGDKSDIYIIRDCEFPVPESGMVGFMAFNPEATTPALGITAYEGERMGASFAATDGLNDDWLISPMLRMPADNASLVMQVQSYTDQYGLEKYEVCVSTTDNDPDSFTVLKSGSAPTDWEEVTVDLSEYAGKDIYVAIHCVSEDAFIFFVDNIEITKPKSGVDDVATGDAALRLYPNPVSETLVISGMGIENVSIWSMAGAQVGNIDCGGSEVRYDVSGLASGVYFAKVKTATGTQVMKFVVK